MLYGSVGRVGLRALLGSVAFTPLSLFAAGEQGVWLDNSDFTTLFQDAAGTTPVTGYEQFVGLRLDKSKGLVLGSELVTNGDFSNGTTGWESGSSNTTLSVVNGEAKSEVTTATSVALLYRPVAFATSNVLYKVEFDVYSPNYFGLIRCSLNDSLAADGFSFTTTVPPNKTRVTSYLRAGPTPKLYITSTPSALSLGSIVYFDNVSVKQVQGNHAYQTTTTARAVLSARYNLLTRTEDFSVGGVWVPTRATATVSKLSSNATANQLFPQIWQDTSKESASITYTFSVEAKEDELRYLGTALQDTSNSNGVFSHTDTRTGLPAGSNQGSFGSGFTIVSVTRTLLTDGYCRVALTATSSTTTTLRAAIICSKTSNFTATNYVVGEGMFLRRADLRVANESSALPQYQRVGAAVNGTSTSIGTPDYDTVGFPAYLRYDGGDWYQTSSIDFSTGATNPPLGPELVTNGDFSDGTTGLTASNAILSVVSGRLRVENTLSVNGYASFNLSGLVSVGQVYCLRYDAFTGTAQATIRLGRNPNGTEYASISPAFSGGILYFTPSTNTNLYVTLRVNSTVAGQYAEFDNISVKELTDANYAPDKMSVFTGVRKLSDTNTGTVVQLSSSTVTNNGIFGVYAPFNTGASADYAFISKGTTRVIVDSDAFVGPETVVLTGLGDISGPAAILRRNSLQIAASSSSQGTGNYGAYVLNIGTGSGEYTGREYEIIVLGRAVTATELTNTEGYMEAQTFGKDMQYVYSDELTTATGDLITAADGDQIYMTVNYQ